MNDQTRSWDPPSPLGGHANLPPFPADVFPAWLADEVNAVAEFTQTPRDLAATVALAVLSTAAGGRAVVNVRGSWHEPVNLFAVAAMASGSRKSPVFAEMTAPLLDTEKEMVSQVQAQIIEEETRRKVAKQEAERAAAKAGGTDSNETRTRALAEAITAAQMAEAIAVPVVPRLVADDVTSEAAVSLLAEHGGRMAVLSAEGGIVSTLAGRYSNGVPSFEVFLKGHSGDMLRVDRRGRPAEHVSHPALTLGLCVQPEVLRAIAAIPGARGRGLLARILFALPENLVGRRKVGTPPVSDAVRARYATSVRSLLITLAEWTDPVVLTLTPDAAGLHLDAERELEPRLAPETGDLAVVVEWASKLMGATARVAGLLHLAENLTDGVSRPIGEKSMLAALRVTEFYTVHALAAFDLMEVDPVLAAARYLYAWIERSRPATFTKQQMFSGVSRSRFAKVGELDAPLDLLERHGWIRRLPEPERTGPGRRPSPEYEVHPVLAAESV